jgi:hypothetical protein
MFPIDTARHTSTIEVLAHLWSCPAHGTLRVHERSLVHTQKDRCQGA